MPNVTDSNKPNQENSTYNDTAIISKASIIGISLGVGISVYAAVTVAGVLYYRKRKAIKDKLTHKQYIMFADSISSPVMQSNSLGFVPAPYRKPSKLQY